MKPTGFVFFGAILLVCAVSPPRSPAQDRDSEVTVPWDEFKKLIRLDEDEIVIPMELFQKLVLQTGTRTVPPHSVKEGDVVLTRDQFRSIVEQMKPPGALDTPPPFDYLITRALYDGVMRKSDTRFTVTFDIHVLKKDAYLKVPLLPQHIALEQIKVNGERALVVSEGGYHQIVLARAGEHTVQATFSVVSSLDKGPYKIDLAIVQTPITLLRLEMPLKEIDVEIPQAQQLAVTPRGGSTHVSAVISSGRSISVRWRKKVQAAEKIPPKLYCEVHHLISIEDDALRINADLNCNILHSEMDQVSLVIPGDLNVLSVNGEGVGEWQESDIDGQRMLLIPFTYGKKGTVRITLVAEKSLSEGGAVTTFSGPRILDAVRETGFIGIELKTSAEVKIAESDGVEPLAVQKLPQILYNKSVKPLMYGFKYLKHPYSLALEVRKHEKIAVPVATIHSANAVTLFTEDGKVVHRLIYQIRNSAKQFLQIRLPQDSDVWSVFVNNEPVESSINDENELLVPLIRSQTVNNRLQAFPVEVIFCLGQERFSLLGVRRAVLPPVDLLTSQIIWSVYLPNDYAYLYFNSTLEKEEMIRGINVLAGAQRRYNERAMREVRDLDEVTADALSGEGLEKAYFGKEVKSRFRNVPLQEEQLSSQVEAELEFSGRLEDLAQTLPAAAGGAATGTGVLPIQIEVPTGGQLYRFARSIVNPEDPLTMSVTCIRLGMVNLFKWILFLLLLGVLYILRERLVRQIGRLISSVRALDKQNEKMLKKITYSIITPFVLLGLTLVFWSFSTLLTLLFFVLCWVTIIVQVRSFLEKRKKERVSQKEGPAP